MDRLRVAVGHQAPARWCWGTRAYNAGPGRLAALDTATHAAMGSWWVCRRFPATKAGAGSDVALASEEVKPYKCCSQGLESTLSDLQSPPNTPWETRWLDVWLASKGRGPIARGNFRPGYEDTRVAPPVLIHVATLVRIYIYTPPFIFRLKYRRYYYRHALMALPLVGHCMTPVHSARASCLSITVVAVWRATCGRP